MVYKDSIASLRSLITDGMISLLEGEEKIAMIKKKAIAEKHHAPIHQRHDGRYITKVDNGRKQLSASTYEALYDKLYDYYYGEHNHTMKSFYPQWIEYRRNESSVKEKTIKENGFLWNRHLESSGFVLKPLNAVSAPDCIAFFRSITKGRKMTRKRFNDLKSVMNGIFFYAVERGIISHNPLLEINYRQFSYKPENRVIVPYTEEERQQILDYLPDNDLYSLAIKLFFCLPIRIGELKGLCFSDIDNYGNIHIERFVNDKNQIENDIKGHTSSGIRWIPLSSTASNYIEHIRYINPHSDFLFMKN